MLVIRQKHFFHRRIFFFIKVEICLKEVKLFKNKSFFHVRDFITTYETF